MLSEWNSFVCRGLTVLGGIVLWQLPKYQSTTSSNYRSYSQARTAQGYKQKELLVILEKSGVLSSAKELSQLVACGSRVSTSTASLANKKPLELGVNEGVLNQPKKELKHQFHEPGMRSRHQSRQWEDGYPSFPPLRGVPHHFPEVPQKD